MPFRAVGRILLGWVRSRERRKHEHLGGGGGGGGGDRGYISSGNVENVNLLKSAFPAFRESF